MADQHGDRLLGARSPSARPGGGRAPASRRPARRGRPGARRAPARCPAAAACRRRRAPSRSGPGPRPGAARPGRRGRRWAVTMPGNTACPISAGARRDHDLGEARARLNRVSATSPAASSARKARCRSAASAAAAGGRRARSGCRPRRASPRRSGPSASPSWTPTSVEAGIAPTDRPPLARARRRASPRAPAAGTAPSSSRYCSTSVRACCAEVGAASTAPLRFGSRRWPSSRMIAMVPSSSGTPTQANSKKPNGAWPASTAASDTRTFTGVPVSASSEPACAGEHQRHQQLRRRPAEPDGHDHDHRQEGGDRAVDADQRGEHGDQQHGEDEQARACLAGPAIRICPAQAVTPGRARR